MENMKLIKSLVILFALFITLPVSAQFDQNSRKLYLNYSTDSKGLTAYDDGAPTYEPSTRFDAFNYVDTTNNVLYVYTDTAFHVQGVITQASAPPEISTTSNPRIVYRESFWMNTGDDQLYFFDTDASGWMPINGIYRASAQPSNIAATGSSAAIIYTNSFFYDTDIDSMFYYTGGSWVNVNDGTAAGGFVTIAQLGDSIAQVRSEIPYSDTSATNEIQAISKSNDTLFLSNGGGFVIVPSLTGVTLSQLVDSMNVVRSEIPYSDTSATNEIQTIDIASYLLGNITIGLSGANTVLIPLPDTSATNEIQTISKSGDTLFLSNGGGSVIVNTIQNTSMNVVGTTVQVVDEAGAVGIDIDPVFATDSQLGDSIAQVRSEIPQLISDLNDVDKTGWVENQVLKFNAAGNLVPATDNTASSGSGETNEAINIGGQTQVFKAKVDTVFQFRTLEGVGIASINQTDTTLEISVTEADGDPANELQLLTNSSVASGSRLTLSNGGGDIDILGGTNTTITHGSGTITINVPSLDDADADAGNELQTLSSADITGGGRLTLSNGGGSFDIIAGTNVTVTHTAGVYEISASGGSGGSFNSFTWGNGTTTTTIEDGETINVQGGVNGIDVAGGGTNDLTVNLDFSELTSATIDSFTEFVGWDSDVGVEERFTDNQVQAWIETFTINSEVDGSLSNEGALTVAAGTSSTAIIESNTSGSTDITLEAGSNVTISESGNTITISASSSGGALPSASRWQMLQSDSLGNYKSVPQSQPAQITYEGGVDCHCGDSNTKGRPFNIEAYNEVLYNEGAPRENYIVYNIGVNGSTMEHWVNSIAAAVPDSFLHDYPISTGGHTMTPYFNRLVNGDSEGRHCNTIFLQLGTNDAGTPGRRNSSGAYSIGSYEYLNYHLDSLVSHLLLNTTANIVLKIPPPYAFDVPDGAFEALAGFTDADEAAAYSDTLKMIYTEWITDHPHPRVSVFNSHDAVFGNRVDSAGVAPLAAWSKQVLPLMDDVYHPTKAGYLETWWGIRHQLHGDFVKPSKPQREIDEDILIDAKWAIPVNLQAYGVGQYSVELDHTSVLYGNKDQIDSLKGKYKLLAENERTSIMSFQLKNAELIEVSALEFDTLYLYVFETENTYKVWGTIDSTIVTNTVDGPPRSTIYYTGGDNITNEVSGPCILYHKSVNAVPFRSPWVKDGILNQIYLSGVSSARINSATVAGNSVFSVEGLTTDNTQWSFVSESQNAGNAQKHSAFFVPNMSTVSQGYWAIDMGRNSSTTEHMKFGFIRSAGLSDGVGLWWGSGTYAVLMRLNQTGRFRLTQYGSGNFEPVDLSLTPSIYEPIFSTNGTLMEKRVNYGTDSGTTDASGDLTFTHGLGVPVEIYSINWIAGAFDWEILSENNTTVTIRLYDKASGIAAASTAYSIKWKAEGRND